MSNDSNSKENKRRANEEKFFTRSWTHSFYFWKLRQVMLGQTVLNLLNKSPSSTKLHIVDLGCGPGTNLFDIFDICAEFKQAEWFGR